MERKKHRRERENEKERQKPKENRHERNGRREVERKKDRREREKREERREKREERRAEEHRTHTVALHELGQQPELGQLLCPLGDVLRGHGRRARPPVLGQAAQHCARDSSEGRRQKSAASRVSPCPRPWLAGRRSRRRYLYTVRLYTGGYGVTVYTVVCSTVRDDE